MGCPCQRPVLATKRMSESKTSKYTITYLGSSASTAIMELRESVGPNSCFQNGDNYEGTRILI